MKREQFIALLYGLVVILTLIFVSSLFITFIIRFTTINEKVISMMTLIIGIIVLFLGGLIAGVKGKGKGFLIGGLTGLTFTLLIFIIQYLGFDQAFTMKQSVHHLIYLLAAATGGIVGVNVFLSSDQ